MKIFKISISCAFLALVVLSSGYLWAQDNNVSRADGTASTGDEIKVEASDKAAVDAVAGKDSPSAADLNGTIEKKEAVKKDDGNTKPESEKPVAKKEAPRKEVPVARAEEKPETGMGADNGALLSIEDGNFRYSRIPGIKLKQPSSETGGEIVHVPSETENISSDQNSSKEKGNGLLGMSKSTTDIVVKVALLLLIFLVFILYRIRSGRSNRRVLRSFRK